MNDEKIKQLLKQKYQLLKQEGYQEFQRLEDMFHRRTSGRYVADFILGANDGIITTFVIVAAAMGAALSELVIVILGVANLLGDGISMGFGNYLGQKSEADYHRGQRHKEEWEIVHLPDVEKQEIREIFGKWGFTGSDLDRAVDIVTADKKVWVDIMMTEELGIVEEGSLKPAKSGLVTFGAFVLAGAIPLLPFFIPGSAAFGTQLSVVFSAVGLFLIGALRSLVSPQYWFRGGLEMLLIGGLAGGIAYLAGVGVERFLEVA